MVGDPILFTREDAVNGHGRSLTVLDLPSDPLPYETGTWGRRPPMI
jgi:hypothetical protein